MTSQAAAPDTLQIIPPQKANITDLMKNTGSTGHQQETLREIITVKNGAMKIAADLTAAGGANETERKNAQQYEPAALAAPAPIE